MRKIIAALISGILFGSTIFAQTWKPVNQTGTSFILYGMSFPPGQNSIGYACGMKYTYDAEGVIVKTTDGGDNWTKIWPQSGQINGLEGIWFINDKLGFAGGWNNYFIRTTDGGLTWTQVSCGSNVWYYEDVVFRDNLNGVVAAAMNGASDQCIFITSDGGNTWVPATSGTNVNIMRVAYADDNTLFGVGMAGKVYKSTDKGHNWSVSANLGPILSGIDFATGKFGIIGAEEHMYVTTDGGLTWKMHNAAYEFLFGCKAFDDGTAYWAGDDNIYKTTDFGNTIQLDYQGPIGETTFYRVRSTPNGNLFASGSGGTILKKSAPLSANFTASPTTICKYGSVAFTDLSLGNVVSWSWSFEGGTPSTSTEQNPVITYQEAGTFDVTLTVYGSVGSNTLTINDMITVEECVGVEKTEIPEIRVFPNPAGDYLNISIRFKQGEDYKLSIQNLSGQTVRTINGAGSGKEETVQVNVSDLPEGNYLLTAGTAAGNRTHHKFVVVR